MRRCKECGTLVVVHAAVSPTDQIGCPTCRANNWEPYYSAEEKAHEEATRDRKP